MNATVTGICPRCHTDTLEFDYAGTVSGPGIQPYPNVCELLIKGCKCRLTAREIERVRTDIIENPERYFGRN